MGLTAEKIVLGVKFISGLDSFPIFCGYLLMILLAGQWKKIARPLSLRHILVVYNLTASALSLYLFCGFCHGLYHAKSSFEASPSDLLKPIFRIYWISKILELLDTVFMILRHRQRQISFLHVYHHGSMLILSDLAFNHYPYPAFAPYLGLNCVVHVLLYLYYGLTALYPDNPPQWKKFLTQFQIIQFVIDLAHATVGYLYFNYCIYGILYGITMISLFSNFYYNAYVKKRNVLSRKYANGVNKTQTNGTVCSNGPSNGHLTNE